MKRQSGSGQTAKSQGAVEARTMSAVSHSQSEIVVAKATTNGDGKAKDYLKAIGMDPSKFWPKKYRFTREKPTGHHNPLTVSERNFYEANGYLVFDNCVSKKLLDSLRASFDGTQDSIDESLVDRLLVRNNSLLQYVKCFCDESLMLMTHRLLDSFETDDMRDVIDNGQQQRQVLCRDWVYLPFRPIDKICCAVTAIEPLEHTLLVVPGTHRIGQCTISSTLDQETNLSELGPNLSSREVFESSPERLSTLVDKSKSGFKYIDLKPGQTLFYHPGLIHGFKVDLANFRRKQLVSIAYYAAADCEFIQQRHQLQARQNEVKQAERAPIPIGLAHFGPDKHPADYTSWLNRPRLIYERDASL